MIISTPLILIMIFVSVYMMKVDLTIMNKQGIKWISVRCLLSILGISSLYSALKYLPTTKVLFIKNLHPLLVTMCGYLFLCERVNKLDVISLFGSFSGTIVMNLTKTSSQSHEATSFGTMIGIILSVAATFWITI